MIDDLLGVNFQEVDNTSADKLVTANSPLHIIQIAEVGKMLLKYAFVLSDYIEFDTVQM